MTAAAPRIDERLRRFIAGSFDRDTPAGITRATGELAWQLGLVRPSYQQVRVLVRIAGRKRTRRTGSVRVTVRLLFRVLAALRRILRLLMHGLDDGRRRRHRDRHRNRGRGS